MALDYERYPILGREPTTLYEHYRVNPMGRTYPEWIEDRIVDLLKLPGRVQRQLPGNTWEHGVSGGAHAVGHCLEIAIEAHRRNLNARIRVALLYGTIIKEWPNNGET